MSKLIIVSLVVLLVACAKAPEAKVEYFAEGHVWFYKVDGQWQSTQAVVPIINVEAGSFLTRQLLLRSGNSVLCSDVPQYDNEAVRCTPKHFSLGEKTGEVFRKNGQWVNADGKKI